MFIFRHLIAYPQNHKAVKPPRPSKSVALDGIPAHIIKDCSDILITVLKFIFNLRLSQRKAGRSGIESRWVARFSAPLKIGPETHPASYTMGTGSFPGVKRPGRGVDHPPHLVPRLKKE